MLIFDHSRHKPIFIKPNHLLINLGNCNLSLPNSRPKLRYTPLEPPDKPQVINSGNPASDNHSLNTFWNLCIDVNQLFPWDT